MKNEALFDRRVLEMNFREGNLAEADYAKFIKALPDQEANAAWASILDLAPTSYLRRGLGIEKNQPEEKAPDKTPEPAKTRK
jgi:hypothetical protein